MQNKGFIRIFAILLALVCLYQLTFTFVARKVRNQAADYAQGDLQKELAYLDSISNEVVYNLGFAKFNYREVQEQEVNLGLDLKGGMNVTMEISVVDIVKALSNYSTDENFQKALALANQRHKDSDADFIKLFGDAFEEVNPDGQLASIFLTQQLKDQVTYNSSNKEVLDVLRAETQSAVDNAFNILRSRIDRFGVTQPNIQRLETQGRILVELPGVKDPKRVRKLLQGTANLEFWETYENKDIYQYLLQANNLIREIQAPVAEETTEEEAEAPLKEGDDLLAEMAGDSIAADSLSAQDQSMRNFPLFAILSPNVYRDNTLGHGPVVGYAQGRDTAKVNKLLALKQVKAVFPRDLVLKWTIKTRKGSPLFELVAIKVTQRDGRAPLDGDVITDARPEVSQTSSTSEVTMAMNTEGAKKWARMTKENVGHSIAVILDDYVYSYPTVQTEISGGRSQITGDFTYEEAKDLANVLKSGKLPAPARIVQDTVVGPSLGEESINNGLTSFVIAFIVVLLYMFFYYGRVAGMVADIALIANLFFMMGVLASFGAVLTLPGIAGIVLTIGMSVDANVLIYERIREEIAGGKGLRKAVEDGYKNAISAIVDANVTTFLTGFILFTFGTGPIKGFATTLMIGIVTSFFTAVFITRLIYDRLLRKDRKIDFTTNLTRNWFKNPAVKFIEKRKMFYVISGAAIVLSLVSLVFHGLDKGIDFTGGRTYIVRFDQDVKTVDIQNSLKKVFEGDLPDVKTFGGENQVKISTNYKIDIDEKEVDAEIESKLYEGMKPFIGADVDEATFLSDYRMSSQKVGPTIAHDIKQGAILSIFFSLLVIFLYILARFRNWQYSMGAIAALGHDVIIVLGLFSITFSFMPFSMEIDQAFIAAILTVIGYSINDTVVVFDRIRERVGLYPKRDLDLVINNALNSTLSRTFSTSLSTFVVLLSIFIFGGEVIRGFIFALLIGVVVGTYSSLFIATPVAYDTILKTRKQEKETAKGKKKK